jgi:hypothetical protein
MNLLNNKKWNYDSLLIYMLFFYPVVAIITSVTTTIYSITSITVTHYAFVVLIYSYYLIFKKKLFFRSLLILFLILYSVNIILSANPWVSVRDLMPVNLLINLIILFYSGKMSIMRLNTTFRNIIFSVTLAGFYIFILGVDIMADAYIGNYHAGLYELPHRAAAYLFVIFIYSAMMDKKINIFYVLALAGIFLTGVRTIILALFIFIIIDLISRFVLLNKRNLNYVLKFMAVFFILSLVVVLARPAGVENVFERLGELTDTDDISRYGSGRVEITRFLLSDISQRSTFDFLFGRPVIEQYESAERHFGLPLWAHNDFLMVLYVLGLLGLIIYVYYVIFKPFNYLIKQRFVHKNISIFVSGIGLLISILFIAVANGFYYYVMLHVLFYILYVHGLNVEKARKVTKYY